MTARERAEALFKEWGVGGEPPFSAIEEALEVHAREASREAAEMMLKACLAVVMRRVCSTYCGHGVCAGKRDVAANLRALPLSA